VKTQPKEVKLAVCQEEEEEKQVDPCLLKPSYTKLYFQLVDGVYKLEVFYGET
jgi:hypothetical protein